MIGGILWMKSRQSRLPPIGDEYSYIDEGRNTWANLRNGFPKNPFDVLPGLRPPGTVLITYPFGFDNDYRAYRFRTVFIPFLVWTLAVWLLCWPRRGEGTSLSRWTAVWAAIVFGANPIFFHLDSRSNHINWGLVDQALGAFAGLSLALLARAMAARSTALLTAGVATAAFCLAIKPTGSLVLLLTGVYFCVGEALRYRENRRRGKASFPRFLLTGLMLFVFLGGGLSVLSLTTEYLSPGVVATSRRAQAILLAQEANIDLTFIVLSKYYTYLGLPGLMLLAATVAVLIREGRSGLVRQDSFNLWAFLLIILFGYLVSKFMLGLSLQRYFSPFAFLALAALLSWHVARPAVAEGRLLGRPVGVLGLLMAANTAMIAAYPAPSETWEGVTGVNTSVARPLPAEIRMGVWITRALCNTEREPVVYILHRECTHGWVMGQSSNVRKRRGDSTKGFHGRDHNIWLDSSVLDLRTVVLESDFILSKAGPAEPHPTVSEFAPMSDFIWREAQAGRVRTIHRMGNMMLVQIPDKGAFLSAFNAAHVGHRWSAAFIRMNKVVDGRVHLLDTLAGKPPYPEGVPVPMNGKFSLDVMNTAPGNGDTLRALGYLALKGWVATDTVRGRPADAVFVTVESPGQPIRFARAERWARPDVASHFGHASLRMAGFQANLSLSGLERHVTLGLAYLMDGRWHRIPGFRKLLVVEAESPLPRLPTGLEPEGRSWPAADRSGSGPHTAFRIERIDGTAPRAGEPVRVREWLEIEGWLAANTLAGAVPDTVWLTLDRPGEPTRVGRLEMVSRPDVATYFRKPGLTQSGFRGFLHLPSLEGAFQLGLAYHREGRWHRVAGSQHSVRFSPLE